MGVGVVGNYSGYDQAAYPVVTPFPYIAYEWKNARLGIDGFNYDFFSTGALEFTMLLEPRFTFADPDDSPLFEGIERDSAVEVGTKVTLDLDAFYLEAQLLQDVSDTHDGFETTLAAGVGINIGALEITAEFGAVFKSGDLNSYLYGVRNNEESPTLPAFRPNNSLQPFFGVNTTLQTGSTSAFVFYSRYERFSSNVQASPLIGKSGEGALGFAYIKQF
ncbi:MAG: MipA/OmpV family protein [Pseudomonadota bacterium]